ncbi:MAG: hypothetical protein OXG98_16855 [Gemmatimonadetes bacterium]|nr:hypothetical protein [Gemmatimonadota bacterium]
MHAYLRRVLNRWRLMLILRGLSVLAIAGVVLLLLCVSAVQVFDPGRSFSVLLPAVALATLGYLAFRYLAVPLRRTPSDLQVARYIEERHPELNDAFVSAVEYGDARLRGPQRALLDQLLEHVAEYSEQIDFKRIVDRRRHLRLHAAAGFAALLLLVMVFLDPGYFGRSALRLVSWSVVVPGGPGEIAVDPGDARVRRGESQAVTARLGSGLTADPSLFVRFGQDADWSMLELYATDDERTFTASIPGISEDARYYVAVAETRSREFRITAFDPPYVERIDVRYDFPAYTGLAAKTEEDRGDITAPVATRVTLTVTASKMVESAELRFSNGRSVQLEAAGRNQEGSFVVREDLSYVVHLVDSNDAENDDPVEYYVRALPDRAPQVTILEPKRDTRASPVDEVMIRAEAVDDFGLSSFSLNYAVNGGEEQIVDLGAQQDGSGRTVWEGEHVVYLENLSVQPGDFVAYYAAAGDRRGEAGTTATDMYFIEVKPFDETYRQGESGSGGGGGGNDVMQTRQLSRKQKEIISATWRVKRTLAGNPGIRMEEDLKAIAAVQDDLRGQADEALAFMRFLVGFSREAMKMAETLEMALGPMGAASDALRSGSIDDALVHEREALMYLTRLDAQMRDYTVNRGRGMAGRAPLDMSDTSELELEDEKNRYERPDQPAMDRQRERRIDENHQRIRDLARRQQQLNDRMRQLAEAEAEERQEAGRRRELDRLTRSQRELREETEEIARTLSGSENDPRTRGSRPGSADPMLDQAERELRESSEAMGETIEQLRRDRLQQAAEDGSQAARGLTDASRQLQRAQGASLERLAREAVRLADQLAAQQEQLARNVGELKVEKDGGFEGIRNRLDAIETRRGGLDEAVREQRLDRFVRERLRRVEVAKEEIRTDLERLGQDLDYLVRNSSREQPETAEAATEALDMIDENGLNERIERSKRLLRRDTLDQSVRTEEEISAALGRLADQVRTARDRLITRDMDHLARAQESTRDAMAEWQNLQRRLYRLNRGIPDPQSLDEISRDYQRQLQRLRDLSGQMPQMSRETGQLQDDLDRALALGNEPWKIDRGKWNELHNNLARSLRDYYEGLRAEVRDMRRGERLYLAREEEVPPGYRDLVNDYFEQLSKNRDRN